MVNFPNFLSHPHKHVNTVNKKQPSLVSEIRWPAVDNHVGFAEHDYVFKFKLNTLTLNNRINKSHHSQVTHISFILKGALKMKFLKKVFNSNKSNLLALQKNKFTNQ